jgi:arginase
MRSPAARMTTVEIALLDAPSNLGLRPPAEDAVPGVYKLAGALRDQGILERLAARDAGVVVPPRYRSSWDGKSVRNLEAIAAYSRKLAERVELILRNDEFALVLGGDCSILLGNLLALRRRGSIGLAFVDAHSDFRHLGNSDSVIAAAGEDLALACGLGDPQLTSPDGTPPLVEPSDVAVVGVRDDDVALDELVRREIATFTSTAVRTQGARDVAEHALEHLRSRAPERIWIHLDVDIVDPTLLPAVDSPTAGGIDFAQLSELVATLAEAPETAGMEVTIFDPDLDPDGTQAAALADMLVDGLRPVTGRV